jgi:hypothetical protein
MNKIKIFCPEEVSLNQFPLSEELKNYFILIQDDENFDPNYDISCVRFTTSIPKIDINKPVLLDGLWEQFLLDNFNTDILGKFLAMLGAYRRNSNDTTLRVPKWFWYTEKSFFGKPDIINLNQDLKKFLFLMPINRRREWRIDFVESLGHDLLDKSRYSLVCNGITLESNTLDEKQRLSYPDWYIESGISDDTSGPDVYQRLFDPLWYSETYFSMVLETTIDKKSSEIFITEKTFKPIMHGHPFMIYGQAGILAELKRWGFETYENIFDEEYDNIEDNEQRKNKIIDNIRNVDSSQFVTKLTLEKILHNRNLFFNDQFYKQGIYTDIVKPIQDFLKRAL